MKTNGNEANEAKREKRMKPKSHSNAEKMLSENKSRREHFPWDDCRLG